MEKYIQILGLLESHSYDVLKNMFGSAVDEAVVIGYAVRSGNRLVKTEKGIKATQPVELIENEHLKNGFGLICD